jgi:hypothetical protein
MRSLTSGGAAVRSRHVVGMLLARALLGLLLGLLAAFARHAGGTRMAEGATRASVWTADDQLDLNPASGVSDGSQTVHEPDSDPPVGLGPLVVPSLGRLTSWSRS